MLPSGNNQISSNNNKNPGNDRQINICLHDLFSSSNKEVNDEQKYAADNGRKENGVNNIPFDHNFTSLINSKEASVKLKVIIKDIPVTDKKSAIFWGRAKRGAITPIENHATAILPKISANFSNCDEENFTIVENDTISKVEMSTFDELRNKSVSGEKIVKISNGYVVVTQKPKIKNKKHILKKMKILNTKFEILNNIKILNSNVPNLFGISVTWVLNLFRILVFMI